MYHGNLWVINYLSSIVYPQSLHPHYRKDRRMQKWPQMDFPLIEGIPAGPIYKYYEFQEISKIMNLQKYFNIKLFTSNNPKYIPVV